MRSLPLQLRAEQSFREANGSSFAAAKWLSLPVAGSVTLHPPSDFSPCVRPGVYCMSCLCLALKDTGGRRRPCAWRCVWSLLADPRPWDRAGKRTPGNAALVGWGRGCVGLQQGLGGELGPRWGEAGLQSQGGESWGSSGSRATQESARQCL